MPPQPRAASQPPRAPDPVSSPAAPAPAAPSPWPSYRSPLAAPGSDGGPGVATGDSPQPVPIRSHTHTHFASAMRDRAFPSTFEDDESELLDDLQNPLRGAADDRYVPPSLSRGRPTSYAHDSTRSRSHSLATVATSPSLSYLRTPTMQSWNESPLSLGPARYADFKPPQNHPSTRYGSLGTLRASPSRIHASPSPSSPLAPAPTSSMPFLSSNGFSSASSSHRYHDLSNMSPFVRDVGEILLDSNSGLGSLWAGLPRDEGSGTTSGTTSRRHSVSVVQPRRGGNNIVGFNAPGSADSPLDEQQPVTRSHVFHGPSSYYPPVGAARARAGSGAGGSGAGDTASSSISALGRSLLLTDDELAVDLGLLNINPNEPPPSSSSSTNIPSQPSSLPIYGPRDTSSPFRGLGTNGGGSYFTSSIRQQRQQISTPSDDYSGTSGSPQKSALGVQFDANPQPQQLYSTEGVKGSPFINTRVPTYAAAGPSPSPLSPTSTSSFSTSPTATRLINPQQPPYYAHQRRLSDAAHGTSGSGPATTAGVPDAVGPRPALSTPSAHLNELGKGIPLHSVPSSCPLFIVEFKAGRTDLYYLPDANAKLDVRVGDIVIVEADRGRDLGKVVNDGITVREVEAWQRQQAERAQVQQAQAQAQVLVGPDGQPTSPVAGTGKKDINPKMIYAKAGPHETQLLAAKTQDELKALQLCQSKVRAKKLPMEVVDAEYQWDRRKLTFYFVADKRIDFRELVRELFRLYKTRIWMASLQGPGGYEQ